MDCCENKTDANCPIKTGFRACLKSRFRREIAEFGLRRSGVRRTHSEEGVWKPNDAKPQAKGGDCSRNGDFKQALSRAQGFCVYAADWLCAHPALTIASIFALDRVTKFFARKYLSGTGGIELFRWLHLTYTENTGAAFSMLRGMNWLFIAVSVALLAGIYISRKQIECYGRSAKLGLLFVTGGALGNLWDRIFYGAVTDFVDFRIWPVFNAADSFITVGGIMLAVAFYFDGQEEPPAKN